MKINKKAIRINLKNNLYEISAESEKSKKEREAETEKNSFIGNEKTVIDNENQRSDNVDVN